MKIDIVYLWVDGNDPEWRKRRAPYIAKENQSDKDTFCEGRTFDNEELRYSLRSVEMYASWVNHIYIVTDRQTPKWLNTASDKITIVDQNDLIPKNIRPIYNSCAIELCIHRIEGLSEHYIYANDDMMFGRAVTPEFFFTPEGRAKSRFIKAKTISDSGAYTHTINLANQAISRDFGLECQHWTPHHQIDAYKKSSVESCIDHYKGWSDLTLSHRFRDHEDMHRHIFSLYAVATGDAEPIFISKPRLFSIKSLWQSLMGGVSSLVLLLHKGGAKSKIKMLRPALLCFNDTALTTNDNRAATKILLNKLYPQPSQFEI